MSGALSQKQMVISPYEALLYAIGYIVLVFYLFRGTYNYSQHEIFDEVAREDALGQFYDVNSIFWLTFIPLVQDVWLVFILYLIVSKILRSLFNPVAWSATCGVLGMMFIAYMFGWKPLLLYWAIITYHAAISLIFGNRVLLWIAHLGFYCIVQRESAVDYYKTIMVKKHVYVMYPSMTLLAIRCLVFFDDALRLKTRVVSKANLAVFLHYCFYPPVFTYGPILLHQDFSKNVYKPIVLKPSYLAFRAFRLLLATILIRASFYIYYNTITALPEVTPADSSILFGAYYMGGIHFYLEFVIWYGLGNVASAFDGIEAPDWPRCISHIFNYSEMWRTFDVGLYNFIKQHIYIPLGGSRVGVPRKLFANAVCFVYIVIYHGIRFDVYIWVVMNYIQIVAETALVKFYHSEFAKPLTKALSPAWTRRIVGVIGAAAFVYSMHSFFYFRFGYESVNDKIKHTDSPFWYWASFLGVGFFVTQLSIECRVRGWYSENRKTCPFHANDKEKEKKKHE